jgi:intracellular multiplication protein IcmQ
MSDSIKIFDSKSQNLEVNTAQPTAQTQPPKSVDLSLRLVEILDKLLSTGSWESSLFLKNANKRLQDLRSQAQQLVDAHNKDEMRSAAQKARELEPGIIKIYISLYQTEGADLQRWLHSLKALAIYNVSRPTYRNEHNVRETIASKAEMQRHGYAVVLIHESDVIPIDPVPVDTLGHELLILKEGAIQLSNIIGFVHANRKKYLFQNNQLVFEKEIEDH